MSLTSLPQQNTIRAVHLRGMDLLNNPALNKGTAFTEDERESFGLNGLLPPVIESLDDQVGRAYQAFSLK
jgi:malate dehydrogenase (oxaloacetate-decarboxylating)